MGRRYDLSKTKNTVTEIFKNNTEKFYNCKTKEELIDICHQLLDNADVDTEWTHEFFIRLGLTKSFEQARSYVYNAMLRGMGHGVIGYRRQYEECDNAESLNESMSSSDAEDFKKKLKAGEVKFKYMKKDGSERTAIGTLKPELMDLPEKKTSSDVDKASENQKKKRKLPADSVFYYDLEAKGFRSFKMSNFVDYI